MELDHNLLWNFTSLVAAVLFFGTATVTTLRRIKLRWPVCVNCWFCNNDTKVYHCELDWWQCPTCEQYNGFTKDGDYAYVIPEQRRLFSRNFAKPIPRKEAVDKKSLCDKCNRSEELKVAEVRNFESRWFFDSRLKKLKAQLEEKYPLCESCRYLVDSVLRKQSKWLTQYKMLFFKQKSVDEVVHNVKKVDKTVRVFLTMLTSAMIYSPGYWPLPFVGAFLQTSAFVINETHKRAWDALLTLLWIFISLVGPLSELNLLDGRFAREWPVLRTMTECQLITVLALAIGLTNLTSSRCSIRSFKASFKKLESPVGKKNEFSVQNGSEGLDKSGEKVERKDYTIYEQSRTEQDSPLTVKSSSLTQELRRLENQEATSLPSSSTINTCRRAADIYRRASEVGRKQILKFDSPYSQYSLNDSLCTLKSLSLGDSRPRHSPRLPGIFKTRVYGSTSPDLFQRTVKSSQSRKFILAPPKLKSVAQTSWVAGGYWQIGVEPPTLSRSSSQSSGFGSAGSNFGPSREPSISKEVDKCSVVSETQFCRTPRPNSTNSVASCCQHSSPFNFPRCESPVCNRTRSTIQNSPFCLKNSSSHFSPVRPEATGCFEHCHTLSNRSFDSSIGQQQNPQAHNFNPGYPGVFTSPVWLPVLLCGSLVFNIAVFCAILLR